MNRLMHAFRTHTAFQGNVMKAELSVGFRLFKERYVSTVIIDPGKRVQARAQETQLFQYLTNDWVLQPGPEPGTCWTNFRVEFCFRSVVYAQVSKWLFELQLGACVILHATRRALYFLMRLCTKWYKRLKTDVV